MTDTDQTLFAPCTLGYYINGVPYCEECDRPMDDQ
jgi:hypothetical protein